MRLLFNRHAVIFITGNKPFSVLYIPELVSVCKFSLDTQESLLYKKKKIIELSLTVRSNEEGQELSKILIERGFNISPQFNSPIEKRFYIDSEKIRLDWIYESILGEERKTVIRVFVPKVRFKELMTIFPKSYKRIISFSYKDHRNYYVLL